jgi:hypothetical protein
MFYQVVLTAFLPSLSFRLRHIGTAANRPCWALRSLLVQVCSPPLEGWPSIPYPHYPDYSAQNVMALKKQQACWGNPKFAVDCLLTNAGSQHEVDRCVLECCEAWISPPPLTTQEQGIL